MTDLTEREELILAHLSKYPELTAFSIARALNRNNPGTRLYAVQVTRSLRRLCAAGKTACEEVPGPGKYNKLIWKVIR